METDFEQYYKKQKTSETPDLWGQIESKLDTHKKKPFYKKKSFLTGLSICACFCVLCTLFLVRNRIEIISKSSSAMTESSENYDASYDLSPNVTADTSGAESDSAAQSSDMADSLAKEPSSVVQYELSIEILEMVDSDEGYICQCKALESCTPLKLTKDMEFSLLIENDKEKYQLGDAIVLLISYDPTDSSPYRVVNE